MIDDWRTKYNDLTRQINEMHTITVMTDRQRERYSKLAYRISAIVERHPEIKRTWNHDRYN